MYKQRPQKLGEPGGVLRPGREIGRTSVAGPYGLRHPLRSHDDARGLKMETPVTLVLHQALGMSIENAMIVVVQEAE